MSHAVKLLRSLYRVVLLRACQQQARSTNPLAARSFLPLEGLEPRLLLSSATLGNDGQLSILGDEADNTVTIQQTAETGDGVDVTVALDGTSVDFTGVKSILVQAGDGNDQIRLLSALTVQTQIEGEDGSDRLTGPDDACDWILDGAGSGTGTGVTFSGFEQIVGGAGDDAFALAGEFGGTVDGGGGGPIRSTIPRPRPVSQSTSPRVSLPEPLASPGSRMSSAAPGTTC